MSDQRNFWQQHLDVIRNNRRGFIGLLIFCLAMGIGIWLGTNGVDAFTRVSLVVVAMLTMFVCGVGYLFPDED